MEKITWKTKKYLCKKNLSNESLMVGPRGLEPLTSTTSMWRSSQMS